jgi:hypothetical protein
LDLFSIDEGMYPQAIVVTPSKCIASTTLEHPLVNFTRVIWNY